MIVANDLEHVRLKVETGNYDCFITFNSDKTGKVTYPHCETVHFTHNLKLGKTKEMFSLANELEAFLLGYFYGAIDNQLAEPLSNFDGDSLEAFELWFVQGHREEFDRLMKMFILTEIELDGKVFHEGEQVFVRTTIPPRLEDGDPDYYSSERLTKLLNLLVVEHLPRGLTSMYDDNFHHPVKGALCYSLKELFNVAAREKMAARAELRKWLEERGQNPADYGIDWEKIT